MARQVEADVARYIDAGMPPEAAAAMARQNAERDLATEKQSNPPSPPAPQEPQPDDQTPQQPFFPPKEGKADTGQQEPAQQQAQTDPAGGKDQAEPDGKDGGGEGITTTIRSAFGAARGLHGGVGLDAGVQPWPVGPAEAGGEAD